MQYLIFYQIIGVYFGGEVEIEETYEESMT
jgi:hypothetical protein